MNERQQVEPGVHYTALNYHRGLPSKDKATWLDSIPVPEEIALFNATWALGWIDGELHSRVGWGAKPGDAGRLTPLGRNWRDIELKFAKFVEGSTNEWHGYPADYQRKPKDRPSVGVLSLWREKNMIEKHHISKIRSGKACNL